MDYCRGNDHLIQKRIENLLKEKFKEELVKYHRGWGFYVELPYNFIRKAGVILQNTKTIEISLYFADTQGQGKAFYPIYIDLQAPEWEKWYIHPNFHFAYMTSNKVWFATSENKKQRYIDHWNQEATNLNQQRGHDALKDFLQGLVNEEIVIDKPAEMQKTIYSSKMNNINVCPGLGFIYPIDLKKAEDLDVKGELANFIESKIIFCLQKLKNVNNMQSFKK